jgi:phosphatidylglycerophosphate synthase
MSCSPIKIGEYNESKFNNFVYSIVKRLVPILYNIGFNPNNITTLSLIFCVLSYNNLKVKNPVCIVYYVIYMVLDYSDGYMARLYNMQSEFGDFYDHARDILFHILILSLIYPSKKLSGMFVLGVILSLNSFGCQEIIYEANCNNKSNSSIGWLKAFCSNNPLLNKFNEYIGSGSVYFFTIIIMWFYCSF